jgi:hypothetical protein
VVLLIEPSTDEMYASFLRVPRCRCGSSTWLTRSAPSVFQASPYSGCYVRTVACASARGSVNRNEA